MLKAGAQTGTNPAIQLRVRLSDQDKKGDRRLEGTPVEDVRQATTEAALGSAHHVFSYGSKLPRRAQTGVGAIDAKIVSGYIRHHGDAIHPGCRRRVLLRSVAAVRMS